jgi:hypothetical protein
MLFKERKPTAIEVNDKTLNKWNPTNPYVGPSLRKDEVHTAVSYANTLKTSHLLDVLGDRTFGRAAPSPPNSRI